MYSCVMESVLWRKCSQVSAGILSLLFVTTTANWWPTTSGRRGQFIIAARVEHYPGVLQVRMDRRRRMGCNSWTQQQANVELLTSDCDCVGFSTRTGSQGRRLVTADSECI